MKNGACPLSFLFYVLYLLTYTFHLSLYGQTPFYYFNILGFRIYGVSLPVNLLGDKIEVVGDDIFVTNTRYIAKSIEQKSANSALIKLNQIGTVSETIEACRMCRDAGWRYFISHRSGETEDTFLADFAVAMDGGHLKTGSASRGERIAKYNRLLEIEKELGDGALYYWK